MAFAVAVAVAVEVVAAAVSSMWRYAKQQYQFTRQQFFAVVSPAAFFEVIVHVATA
jgi:hypothetical protein